MANYSRVDVIGKKNPTDFALWKFEKPGEDRQMVWPSPWHQRSFPGWHIECSAMSMKYLGDQFEIHTGGIDHIPVHHTNEIAQAEAATGKKPFVKIWVHHNFLQVEGEKMSKSLGNFYTIDDLLQQGFLPMALRLLFLTAHYRSEMNFTWDNLQGAQKTWERLSNKFLHLEKAKVKNLGKKAQSYQHQFFTLIEDDLKTPEALALLWEMLKDKELTENDQAELLVEFNQVLGFDFRQNEEIIPEAVQDLLARREATKKDKNFAEADKLRVEIKTMGYEVLDTARGSVIKKSFSHE